MKKEGFITLEALYIDGTKIEANANRYTFVWRGAINYHLAGLLDTIDALYARYNKLLNKNGYGQKYKLENVQMFIIEGMDKVREVIEKNTIIEIDNCSPLELLKLQTNLVTIAEGEGIPFVYEKGHKKSEIQMLYDELEECGKRLMKYKECFEIMGKARNSYSKTDLEATFMRMKEDHMMNGQLKSAYNVQIAVENYFIIHRYVSSDRTDYNTIIPVIKKHFLAFEEKLKEVTADSGYCSEKNLLFLKENHIESYIKLQDHEKGKTRAYREDISKYYNMTSQIFEDEHYYICHDGRELRHKNTETKKQDGYTQTYEVYGCADCSGCEHKAKCLSCKHRKRKRDSKSPDPLHPDGRTFWRYQRKRELSQVQLSFRRQSIQRVHAVCNRTIALLVLGVGMCLVIVYEMIIQGILIGIIGIILLLFLIPMCIGWKKEVEQEM